MEVTQRAKEAAKKIFDHMHTMLHSFALSLVLQQPSFRSRCVDEKGKFLSHSRRANDLPMGIIDVYEVLKVTEKFLKDKQTKSSAPTYELILP